MKKLQALHFVFAGLALALVLAIFISPFASPHPDGLEWIAGEQGFLEKGEGEPAWDKSPAPDYSTPGVKSAGASTAIAGLIGTLLAFGIGFGLERLLRSRGQSQPPVGDPPAGKLAP